MQCIICSQKMEPDILGGTYHCAKCGLYRSIFPVTINTSSSIDEKMREDALKPLRIKNFNKILDACTGSIPPSASILDVGCAHGWFLEAAIKRGCHATGIEPDKTIAIRAQARGNSITVGLFPEAVPPRATYHAIVLNDVLEHLEDLLGVVNALHRHLDGNGRVIINLPVSDGLIFRSARVAARFGIRGPLSRMWQKGMPSPHLYYFSKETLSRFMGQHGFALEKSGTLESLSLRGLFERIRYDRRIGTLEAYTIYSIACLIKLISKLFPKDTRYFIFKKHT